MTWRADLAMIRQRAAARCGLREYPAELIRTSERLDRAGSKTPASIMRQLRERQAELEAELKWIRLDRIEGDRYATQYAAERP